VRRLRWIVLVVAAAFVLPLATHALWWWALGWPDSWSRADWTSARVLPPAEAEPDAVVYVMAARVGRWRGIFAHHSWVVVKPAGAARYVRYDVVGWGPPVRTDHREADARWFGNEPSVLATMRGAAAEAAIPRVRAAVATYPWDSPGTYRAWPGPNSNTFVAHVATAVPDLAPALLPTAVGKDYRPGTSFVGPPPGGFGLQISLGGLVGVTLGWVEGVEVNLLGLVTGVDLRRPALKLPGWGRIGLSP
jgi:hypothetical protein